MRKALWIILAVWSVFAVTGCEEQKRDAIIFGAENMPNNMDPRYATDAMSYRVGRLIYSSLVDFDDSARFVPGIASWKEISQTKYRFSLDSEYFFHNGKRVSSKDIKATYDSILDEKNKSPHRSSVSLIDKIIVIDDDTLDFELSHPDPFFPGYLIVGILPKKLIEEGFDFNENPIGSGPFKFHGRHGVDQFSIERIRDSQVFDFIRVVAPEVRAMKLIRGEIDILQNGMSPELKRYLKGRDEVSIKHSGGTDFAYIGFNLEDEKTSDIRIRQAVAYAIDRDAIIKHVFGGHEKKATAFFPGDHWLGNPNLIPYEYSPEKSKKILKDLGYDKNNPLKLTYKTSTNPFRIRVAAVFQSQLSEVGIDVDIKSYDWGTFYGDIKSGRFQMYSLKWVGIKSPDIFEYVFYSNKIPPDGANRGRYNNKEVDILIDEAKVENSLEGRLDKYRAIQQIIFDELPYVPLWYEGNFFAVNKNIRGYRLSSDGNYDGLINVERISK